MKLDLVDVFGARRLAGNPLGVVRGADAMDGAQMLALTRWLNFSETTFLLPPTDPDADYRVRIFYPAGELPFAGHPTLGSCHAWLQAGGVPKQQGRIVQECGVGLVEIQPDEDRLAFRAPPLIRSGPLTAEEKAEAARLANVPKDWIVDAVHASNGPAWKLLRLRSAADVLAVDAGIRGPVGTDIGLIGPYPEGSAIGFEVRTLFANSFGVLIEDPVTGSRRAISLCGWAGDRQLHCGARPKDRRRWAGLLLDRCPRGGVGWRQGRDDCRQCAGVNAPSLWRGERFTPAQLPFPRRAVPVRPGSSFQRRFSAVRKPHRCRGHVGCERVR